MPCEHPRERRREDPRAVEAQHRQRDRIAELIRADQLGGERHARRSVETERQTLGDRRDEQHPELHDIGDDDDPHPERAGEEHRLAGEEHLPVGEAVRRHPTERRRHEHGHAEAEVHEPECTLAFGEVPCQHPAQQELHLHGEKSEGSGEPQAPIPDDGERRKGAAARGGTSVGGRPTQSSLERRGRLTGIGISAGSGLR